MTHRDYSETEERQPSRDDWHHVYKNTHANYTQFDTNGRMRKFNIEKSLVNAKGYSSDGIDEELLGKSAH